MFTPAPIVQTAIALVAAGVFLATDNVWPAALVLGACAVAWAGYLVRRR